MNGEELYFYLAAVQLDIEKIKNGWKGDAGLHGAREIFDLVDTPMMPINKEKTKMVVPELGYGRHRYTCPMCAYVGVSYSTPDCGKCPAYADGFCRTYSVEPDGEKQIEMLELKEQELLDEMEMFG